MQAVAERTRTAHFSAHTARCGPWMGAPAAAHGEDLLILGALAHRHTTHTNKVDLSRLHDRHNRHGILELPPAAAQVGEYQNLVSLVQFRTAGATYCS